jgi:DtxR family transcriptional regulator, Mn-dependent transcriptional regulator
MEDYIKEIFLLEKENKVARVSGIGKKMDVRKASVVSAVSFLKQRELLTQERYGYINLTDAGRAAAETIIKKYNIIYDFLIDTLKIDGDAAKKEACSIEHSLSERTVLSIAALVKTAGKNAAGKTEKKPARKKTRR